MRRRTPRSAGHPGNHESVATLMMVAISLLALVGVAALVVDLGMARSTRSQAAVVVDNGSVAGALQIGDGNGVSACVGAVNYVEANLGTSFSSIDCAAFSASCSDTTTAVTSTDTNGDWTVSVTHPVPNDSPLLDPAAIGGGSQALHAQDGFPCQRIGVSVSHQRTSFFGGLLGHESLVTNVHAVAIGRKSTQADTAVNLVILERYDCDAITAEGSGGGLGGIEVDVVWDPVNSAILPGYLTVDSDGTGAGCGGDGVLDVDGSDQSIIADGPAGCVGQVGPSESGPGGSSVGRGCGVIQTFAPGTPGCNYPACTSTGTVAPDPAPLRSRVTRAPVDHRYNCKASYSMPAGWEIRGCPDTPDPNIDQMVASLGGAGVPTGYQTWSGLGHNYNCTIEGPVGTTIPVNGNTYVDCDPLTIKRNVHFRGGNVVFEGDVIIESVGVLTINGDSSDPLVADADEVIAFFRGGVFRKAGDASFIAHNTTAYFGPTVTMTMQGGGGSLIWTSPALGQFEYLALWSESPAVHELAGQAFLDMRGIFFTPDAQVLYRGTGVQHQIQAQFVARKLKVQGEGILKVSPSLDAAVLIPEDVIQIIR
jgi:hypothetical protein